MAISMGSPGKPGPCMPGVPRSVSEMSGTSDMNNSEFAVECISALIEIAAQLNPEEMRAVNDHYPFATPIWLNRVADSFKPAISMRNEPARSTSTLLSIAGNDAVVNPYIAARARLTGDAGE